MQCTQFLPITIGHRTVWKGPYFQNLGPILVKSGSDVKSSFNVFVHINYGSRVHAGLLRFTTGESGNNPILGEYTFTASHYCANTNFGSDVRRDLNNSFKDAEQACLYTHYRLSFGANCEKPTHGYAIVLARQMLNFVSLSSLEFGDPTTAITLGA